MFPSVAFQVFLSLYLVLIYLVLRVQTACITSYWCRRIQQVAAKSVSICSEPVSENGPCTKKEQAATGDCAEEDCRDAELRAVAAQVVENVVRLASEAAASCHNDLSFERLPSIHIDTVPSMPPSPTEWPPPPPEATIPEEDETQDEIHQLTNQGHVDEDLQNFAAHYIEDLLSKAMDLAEEKQQCKDRAAVGEVAAQLVEDVISKARETALQRMSEEQHFSESLPTFQIDTVVSLPPSPTDEPDKSKGNARGRPVPEITCMQYEDEEPAKPPHKLIKHSEAPEDVRDFAASYVKDIVSKAMTIAEEKIANSSPFSFEDGDLMKNGPWYIRVRETLMRVLRSACFCTPRRDDS